MTYERLASASLVILIALGTVGFFIFTEPEDSHPVSSDGQLAITATARISQPLVITEGEALAAPLLGVSYHVTPENIQLDQPATLHFVPPLEATSSLAVFRYQPKFMVWEEVPLTVMTDQELAIEVSSLGTFALGEHKDIAAPEFLTAYDELRALAPDSTVGYEIAVGYRVQEDGPYVRLPALGETGGCGGQVQLGDDEVQSTISRQAQVTVDELPTTVEFVFIASWVTSSQGGCAELTPLAAFAPML